MEKANLGRCLEVAIAVARSAGEIVRKAFATPRAASTVMDKSSSIDLVTETDQECEKFIFGMLKKEYPDFHYLGEESASEAGTEILGDEPTWIIDPIDGTTNFVHRTPDIAISIGLSINRRPVVGVIYCPIHDEMYAAYEGGGTTLNGNTIKVDSIAKTLPEAIVFTNMGYGRTEASIAHLLGTTEALMRKGIRAVRMCGSACISIAAIASGRGSCYYECGPHSWDICAGAVLVREAGGVVTGMAGEPLDLCSRSYLAASNEAIAAAVVACIAHPLPIKP